MIQFYMLSVGINLFLISFLLYWHVRYSQIITRGAVVHCVLMIVFPPYMIARILYLLTLKHVTILRYAECILDFLDTMDWEFTCWMNTAIWKRKKHGK